jgi:hypothetical protein
MKITLSIILPALAIGLCLSQPVSADGTQTWPGTLYRNGGYFGDQNSDVVLHRDDSTYTTAKNMPSVPGAPSSSADEAQASMHATTWKGTLYRNGGYFGPENSDESIENPQP